MKQVTAKLRYLRISPRKVRVVADAIRGKSVTEASRVLRFSTRRPAHSIKKLLDSAIANAKHNFQLDKENISVSSIRVDKGPTLKRMRPRARGTGAAINKRTSHISIILSESKKQS
jgi:large subunit ribosomal protein L22